jgi:hypothetical protein
LTAHCARLTVDVNRWRAFWYPITFKEVYILVAVLGRIPAVVIL